MNTEISNCIIENCIHKVRAKRLCNMHYLRFWRYGRYERIRRIVGLSQKEYYQKYKIEIRKYRLEHSSKSIKSMHKKRFGGLREFILQRDEYKCVICGMTDEAHLLIWKRHLTLNHIDHQGRNASYQNNNPDNLETLCLRCHGWKDAIKSGRSSTYLTKLNRERSVNSFYEKINWNRTGSSHVVNDNSSCFRDYRTWKYKY